MRRGGESRRSSERKRVTECLGARKVVLVEPVEMFVLCGSGRMRSRWKCCEQREDEAVRFKTGLTVVCRLLSFSGLSSRLSVCDSPLSRQPADHQTSASSITRSLDEQGAAHSRFRAADMLLHCAMPTLD
ncbi:unnamed protein product [Caenorhabditis auriculariae]|uniref:Uncharacterized protein n=1 Tax=Caenorhabditis auriculariae TaxID=2777116 RepID=A0A8S1HLL5_9PELO|nr:unnamed protein product [Caenorhabditis auriculariae]